MRKIEKKGQKEDKGKLRYDLITEEAIEGMAEVLTKAQEKYTPNSWQNVEDGTNVHYSALMRHLIAHRKGEINDEETGLSHIKHILTNAMFLLYHEQNDKGKRKSN